MNFEDLIGLIISVIVFAFLMIRSAMKKNPEMEEQPAPPPPKLVKPQKLKPAPAIKKNQTIEERYSGSTVVSRRYAIAEAYEVIGKDRPSRAHHLISSLKSKKDMVILKEIIGPPKGFQ